MPQNRLNTLFPLPGAPAQGMVPIFLSFVVAAAGAVETEGENEGVESIVRDSEGLYTITLNDRYPAFRGADITVVCPDAEDIQGQVAAYDLAARTVQVRFFDYDGDGNVAVEDPEDDDEVLIVLWFQEKVVGVRA